MQLMEYFFCITEDFEFIELKYLDIYISDSLDNSQSTLNNCRMYSQ